jgi:hypothetical protein
LQIIGEDVGLGSSGKPVFLQKPFIRQLEDKIFFECKISSDQVPSFTWYLDGTLLKSPDKYKTRILSEGKTHTVILEISNLTSKDSGDYKLVAKNSNGEAESFIKLNIESKRASKLPDGIAPHFVSKPITTQSKDNLLIQLELEANPTPSASWFLDTKELSDLSDSRYTTKIEKKSTDMYLLSLELKV